MGKPAAKEVKKPAAKEVKKQTKKPAEAESPKASRNDSDISAFFGGVGKKRGAAKGKSGKPAGGRKMLTLEVSDDSSSDEELASLKTTMATPRKTKVVETKAKGKPAPKKATKTESKKNTKPAPKKKVVESSSEDEMEIDLEASEGDSEPIQPKVRQAGRGKSKPMFFSDDDSTSEEDDSSF